jgi:hypothetical protein
MAKLVQALCYKPEGRGFDSRYGSWDFPLALYFRPHNYPGVDKAPNKNE